jgi:hypothetical protein
MAGCIKIGEWEVQREVKTFNLRSAESPINCIKIMETSAKNAGSNIVTMRSIPEDDMKYGCSTWEVHTVKTGCTHSVSGKYIC